MTESFVLEESTSRSLLDALRNESTEAWTMVATVYGPLIERWAKGFVKNADDASDVTQNVLVAVIKYAANFRKERPQDGFRKWLYAITRNESRKILGRVREQPIEAEALSQILDVDETGTDDAELLTELQRRALLAVKQSVNTRTWDIYWEALRGNLSTEEIASRFETTAGNVRVIRVRITNRIRELLEMTELDGEELVREPETDV